MGRRAVIASVNVAALLVLAWPAIAPGEVDGLPLSNYPMFAHPRDRVSSHDIVVHVDASGIERRVDLRAVGGTDQPMQAAMTVRQAVRNGEADELCAEIAAGFDRRGTVQVVRVQLDGPGWFAGARDPIDRHVFAECEAPGAP